jgi:cytochrome P450
MDYYVVSRYADIKKICLETKVYSSNLVAILLSGGNTLMKPEGVGVVDVLALADPPVHKRQRQIAMQGMSPRLFASMEPSIRERVKTMLDETARGC